jgi:uncharacterized protein (TIGR00369 family)
VAARQSASRLATVLSSEALEGNDMEQDDLVNAATDHGCFGCGEQNPIGLRLKFYRVDGAVQATFTPSEIHEGYAHMTHGGIVATLLDEAMSWAVIDRGHLAVTAKMGVEFRRPVPVGEPLIVIARVERDRKRLFEATGELRTQTGELLASANGVFMRVSEEQQHAWEAIYGGPKGVER